MKAIIETNTPISKIMTRDLITVDPNTILSTVNDIFKKYTFHHIPVVDNNNKCIGIISSTDYHQLQDKFTKLKVGNYAQTNEQFFNSLLAKEVMQKKVICLKSTAPLSSAIDIFIMNKVHSIILENEKEECNGIITPFDIIYHIKNNVENDYNYIKQEYSIG